MPVAKAAPLIGARTSRPNDYGGEHISITGSAGRTEGRYLPVHAGKRERHNPHGFTTFTPQPARGDVSQNSPYAKHIRLTAQKTLRGSGERDQMHSQKNATIYTASAGTRVTPETLEAVQSAAAEAV